MNIRTLCLGILQFQDATGYEINKLVTDGRFSHFIEASYGSIYPALTRMMAEELVTCREEQQDGRPARKIYSITSKGHALLVAALREYPHPDRVRSEFLFTGLFSDLVPPAHMQQVIARHTQQITDLVRELGESYQRCPHPGSRFAIGYGLAVSEAKLRYIEQNRHLLEAGLDTQPSAPPAALEEKNG